jgi:hypothetical protein
MTHEERQALSEFITDVVEGVLIARVRGFEEKLAELQTSIDHIRALVEKLRHIDSALESIDSAKMN